MKNVKKYLVAVLATALVAPMFIGCSEMEYYTLDSVSAKPSDKFNTKIVFVSRLTDGALITSDADYTAVNTVISKNKQSQNAWLTVFDRTDNSRMDKFMGAISNSRKWSVFAFNRLKSKTVFEGSTLLFNEPSRSALATACGKGCNILGLAPKMVGTRTDKDKNGVAQAPVEVTFNVNFRTGRFDTSEQVSAFGGEAGVMNTLKRDKMNMLMIGTVKNDLFGSLQSTVQSTDGTFNVYKLAQGSGYTLFMLGESRFWGFTSVANEDLGGGITAYTVNVMW